jgi:hypothetical protein
MANATMQALQTHAEKLNQQVAEVNASIKALGDVPDDNSALQEYRKQLRRLNSDLKDVNTTMKDYTRGVKAAGELYRHYAMGNIEDMSIKAIRAGVNGMKKRLDNLKAGGDPGDAEEMRLIEAITTEADVVVKRFKTDYQHVVEEIARGGTVTEQTLKRTRDGLADLMQTAETEAEKNELTNYWQKVGAAIEAVAVENRRLRGEVADREEAMRIAYATDHDGSQQAIHDAEARADAARRENDELRQRLDLKQQQRRELEQEMDINSMQVRALMDRRDELKAQEKEDRAIRNQRVDDANKELNAARRAAKTQQQAYDEQKQTVEKLRTEVQGLTDDIRKMGEVKAEPKVNTEELTRLQEAYNQKVERRKQLEQELEAIKNRSWTDDPEKKRLEEEIAKLNELIAVADKYKKKFAKMSDSKYEEGYMGGDSEVREALHISSDPQKSIWGAADYLKGAYHDRSRASLADFVKDQYPDDNTVAEYQQAAERVAKGIVQNAQENFRRAIYKEIQDGNWTAEAMEQQLDIFRSQFQNDFRNARPGELKDDPEYHYYKYIIEQMEKYIEVARQVEAERGKIAGGKEYLELARQKDDIDQPREGLLWQRQRRDFDSATIKTEDIDRRRKEDERVATEAVAKSKDEEAEAERKLTEAKKQSTTATDAQAQSSEQLAQKQEQLSQKTAELNQQQDKLNGMVDETVTANQRLARAEQEQTDARNAQAEAKKHEGEAVKKVEDELRGLTDEQLKNAQAYSHLTEEINTDTAAMQRNITTEQEATREADRLRSGSIDKMEQALARLRESNRKLDPTIDKEEWERGERAIGQLNLRLEELKKQSAELRREPVLDMMTQRMQSLGTLSRDALTETKKFWEQMVDGAQKGSTELADYEQHLKSIALEEQARVREQGREAFAFFQREDYRRTNAADTEEQRKALVAYRDALPADDTDHIEAINALLEKQAQFVKEAAGEWMSLEKAMELAKTAGTDQFAGSAKDIQLATQSLERQRDTIIATIREKRNLGQTTKAEEDQLADLTKKLRSLKFEQDNVNMSQEKMRTLIETPANAVNLDELRAAIKRADGQLRQMQDSLGQNSDEYKRFAEQVRQAKNVMKEMEGQAKASATAWEKAFSRLKTYVVMYMGFNEVWQKVSNTARDLMDLSDRMGEVRKTTGFTADEVGRLSDNLTKLDTRTNLTGLMEFSSLAGSVGLKTQEAVQGFTEAANMLSVSLPELGKEASRTLMKIADATGDLEKNGGNVRETLERVGSTVIALRANSAAAAGPITDFVSRVGAVGAQAGISIDQIAALGATVDALGGRVEMSATALSRMIPAIRNNTFEVAQAIGMTEKQLKQMSGIDQMVAVFKALNNSVKNFDMTTEEGMNAAADAVEGMLGRSVSMQDVMKQLNQQGARAGIVFGLLSQNVDTLEKQLKIATDAYRDNTALMEEYNKMNETTAAKWERLKNAFEEMWVSDSAQRVLGVLIDMLRKVVDWIAEDGPIIKGLKVMLAYWAAMKMNIGATIASMGAGFKAMGTAIGAGTNVLATAAGAAINSMTGITNSMRGLRAATINARREWIKMDAAMRANIIGALVTALGFLIYKIWDMHHAAKEAAAEVGRFNQKIADERKALNDMFEPLNKSNMAQEERLKLINEINSKYGKYLGYMLSETSSAIQLADAHALIAKRIREEAYERRIAEQTRKVQDEHSDELNESYAKITERVRGSVRNGVDPQEVADILKGIVDSRVADIKYANDNRENFFNPRTTYMLDPKIKAAIDGGIERLIVDGKLSRDNVNLIQKAVYRYTVDAKSQHDEIMKTTANVRSDLRGIQGAIKYDLANNINTLISNVASTVSKAVGSRQPAPSPGQQGPLRPQGGGLPSLFGGGNQQQGGSFSWNVPFWQQGRETTPQQQAAPAGWKPNINKNDVEAVRQFVKDQDALRGALQAGGEQLDEAQRRVAESWLLTDEQLKEYRTIISKADKRGGGGGGGSNPYGQYDKVTSPYKDWNGNDLVARRKEMLERVKALANGADVQAVLSEDAKFISDAVRKNIKTTELAIEWYNTERLKIQEALHGKHLTNTGDWQDPEKVRKRAGRVVQDEMKYYLDELDAYYTERKTRIEQARNDEEITEGEAWRRTIQNDNEWQTRRAELQLLYSRRAAKVTEDEMQAIFGIISERTGETVSYIKADIAQTNKFIVDVGNKSKAAMDRIYGDIELGAEKSYLKAAQAIGKQMKFIEDTLAKERPYDGITKNLQDNLDKMGVLAAKYRRENEELARQGKEPKYSNEQITAQSFDEMAFYLRQAADAYSIDIDELLRRMVKEGMTATAEEISKSDMLKQAVMGQLRKTYQEVQDAIKKEASQIKKDVEIIWNDDARGIGGMSMKATFDKALAQLGMQQDSVSRANSLIGAGAASDNVASRLAMKQIEVQMRMQKAQYDMYRVQAKQRMAALKAEAKEHQRKAELEKQAGHEAAAAEQRTKAMVALRDAENVRLSLGLTLAEETKKQEQQKAELLKIQEESQNRLYTSLREWADLLTSSLQGVFEASHAGDAEYYNERAKLELTGKGGPGAGTYVVIDDAGTSDATAHYEYLDERQALERQHEIERENAMAEAWEKLWDDINMKMSEQITDWMNAALQQQAVAENTAALKLNTDAEQRHLEVVSDENGIVEYNTDAVRSNTGALQALTQQLAQGITIRPATDGGTGSQQGGTTAAPAAATPATGTTTPAPTETTTEGSSDSVVFLPGVTPGVSWQLTEEQLAAEQAQLDQRVEMQREAAEKVRIANEAAFHGAAKTEKDTGNQMAKSNASTFAKMTMSANLYGIAYQAMSNDNLSATQKFEMIALQSVGNFAISSLTAFMSKAVAEGAVNEATVLGKLWSQLGWAAAPVFAIFTGLLGAAMGAATSAVSKSKSQIAQATGSSVGAGRLATGMMTYAEGNVNELTDPASLTPGRQYNVDGADGKTYRARYMGKGAKTHITNGPEFHLVGEAGREAIIDAKTTRLLQMNETGIWRDIQTLYNGGSISGLSTRRRRGGVRAYAEGNVGEFEDMADGGGLTADGMGGMNAEVMTSMLETNSRLADLLENALVNGIKAVNKWTGSDGIPAMYNKMKKEAQRHGEKYL